MLEAYNCETVPQLLQELEEIYTDLCNIVAEAIVQGAEAISTRVSAACYVIALKDGKLVGRKWKIIKTDTLLFEAHA